MFCFWVQPASTKGTGQFCLEPRVDTASVEGMGARQFPDLLIFFNLSQTNWTRFLLGDGFGQNYRAFVIQLKREIELVRIARREDRKDVWNSIILNDFICNKRWGIVWPNSFNVVFKSIFKESVGRYWKVIVFGLVWVQRRRIQLKLTRQQLESMTKLIKFEAALLTHFQATLRWHHEPLVLVFFNLKLEDATLVDPYPVEGFKVVFIFLFFRVFFITPLPNLWAVWDGSFFLLRCFFQWRFDLGAFLSGGLNICFFL